MSETVNYAQANPATGAYITLTTPPPTAPPSVLGIQRQSDCSFSLSELSTTETSFPTSLPVTATGTATFAADFGNYLHAAAGLPAQTVQFPLGCRGFQLGIASQSLVYVGQDDKNDQVLVDNVPTLGYAVVLLNPGSGKLSATPLPQAATLGLGSLTFNVADVNGDGINDLIAVEPFANSSTDPGIFVFLGHADGTFANPVEYTAGTHPVSVAIDDVNGDGKLDLVVDDGNSGPNNIFTLLGNGDGTFKTAISAGSSNSQLVASYVSLAIGDFNGDGKKDLVLSDGEILLGNGNGTFASSVFTLPINLNQYSGGIPVVGDFNNDGKLDVAVNLPSTNSVVSNIGQVSVFLGKGDGTFTTGNSYVNIAGSGHMATEDIDGDGNLDLILGSGDNGVYSAGSNAQGVMQFLMGKGDGTFAGAPAYSNVGYSGLSPIAPVFAVADFNGDGKPDILTDAEVNNSIQGMVLLAGDGQGNFAQKPTIPGDYPLALMAADMNGDKKADAVYIGYHSGGYNIEIALGNGDGTFQSATSTPLTGSQINDMVIGDFNGDGKPDVMVTENASSAGLIELFLGDGNGSLQAPIQVDTPTQAYGIAAGDFNGDGSLDFAVTNTSNGSAQTAGAVLVYLNNGTGTFAKPVSYTASMFPGPIVVADVNQDGKPDLVVASKDNTAPSSTDPFAPNGTLNVLVGKGDGTFQTAITAPLNDANYTNLAVADMNQDGIPDVVVGDNSATATVPSYTQILYGKGDGTFPTGNTLQMGLASQSVTVVDVNGDKRPDLLLTSGSAYLSGHVNLTLDVFVNQFSGKTISTLPATTTALAVKPNPSVAGQAITFTAQVTAGSGTTKPTGTVAFMNGSTQLGTGTLDSSGAATYSTSSLSTGSYPITAVYSGDANYSGSTSSAVTLVVNAQQVNAAPTFTLAAKTTNLSVMPGGSGTVSLSVTPVNGFNAAVSFACSGLPSEASCSFSPATVTPNGTAPASTTMTITTMAPSAQTRRRSGALSGWSGGALAAGFLLFPFLYKKRRYAWMLVVLCTVSILGMSACGGGSGSGSTPPPVTNPGTPAGASTVTVTATSGSGTSAVTQQATVTLTVQ